MGSLQTFPSNNVKVLQSVRNHQQPAVSEVARRKIHFLGRHPPLYRRKSKYSVLSGVLGAESHLHDQVLQASIFKPAMGGQIEVDPSKTSDTRLVLSCSLLSLSCHRIFPRQTLHALPVPPRNAKMRWTSSSSIGYPDQKDGFRTAVLARQIKLYRPNQCSHKSVTRAAIL
jgi:hypothetical protein